MAWQLLPVGCPLPLRLYFAISLCTDINSFWLGELQSLCTFHHNSTKKIIEQRGYDTAIGVDGWPLDQASENFWADLAHLKLLKRFEGPNTRTGAPEFWS
jgi:hypothetical protein